jgi:protein ImuA
MTAGGNALAQLRRQIRQLERSESTAAARPDAVLPFGVPALDTLWPGGGLPVGALHEAAGDATPAGFAAATAFVAALAGRLPHTVLWCARGDTLYAPGLAALGLPPARLLITRLHKDQDILAAMEEGLKHRALGGVVGEVEKLDLTSSRRVQLAAEKSGVMALVLRVPGKSRRSADAVAAASRWHIAAAPSAPHVIPQAGRARWRLTLTRSRYGTTGSWIVEAPDAQGHLHLPASLADRSAAQTDDVIRRTG